MEEEKPVEIKKNPSKVNIYIFFVIILLVGLGFFFFQTIKKPNLEVESKSVESQVNGVSAEVQVQPISVEGGNYYFKPNVIRVKKGEKVTIGFTNTGGFHDFLIDEFNVNSGQVEGGKTKIIEFTPDKTGEFEFYCGVGNHRQMGMKGKLIVE